MIRVDLTREPLLGWALRNRWPQLVVRALLLAGFGLAIVAGLAGTPVGSRNFSIMAVWVGWWALLMLIAVPVFGRAWCSVCPIPLPGEWLQQGAILEPGRGMDGTRGRGRGLGLGWRWPRRWRNIWLQNAAFALLALFSAVILTQPGAMAAALVGLLLVAAGVSLVFERRAFCRYLCPVGGFIGLYAQLAPLEVRVKDPAVCAGHRDKTCYTGSAAGYGCPWGVFPGSLWKNTYCGLCLECLRTCPRDNIALNLRPFGADLLLPRGRKLDEAFKAFLMLGSALMYSAVLLGPWGRLKLAAYTVGSVGWLIYALAFLLFVLALLPGLFALAVAGGRALAGSGVALRKAFTTLAYALVPLGLGAWVAFSLSLVSANAAKLWPVLSDPLGWGWNLFGTAGASGSALLVTAVPGVQLLVLIAALAGSSRAARRLAGQLLPEPAALRLALPVMMFSFGVTTVLMGLLIG